MKLLRIILAGIFVVAGLLYINSIIPAPQKAQATVQGGVAWEYTNISDGLGGTFTLHIGGQDSPSCSSGVINNLTSYAGGFDMFILNDTNKDTADQAFTINVNSQTYFCPTSDLLDDGVNGHHCKSNPQGPLQTRTVSLTPGQYYKSADSAVSMNACGETQWDMSVVVKNKNGDVVFSKGDMTNPGISDQAYWTYCFAGNNGQKNWCTVSTPTPTPTTVVTPTPTIVITPTPTIPEQHHFICQRYACVQVPGWAPHSDCTQAADISSECSHLACGANQTCQRFTGGTANGQEDSCTTNPDSCVQVSPSPSPTPELTVIKVVNNNHGGTKTASDFMIHVKNNSADVTNSPQAGSTSGTTYDLAAGTYTVSEDSMVGYHEVSISGSCDANGNVSLSSGDHKTCVIENEDNGSNTCTMPSCNTTIPGCSYPFPDTNACSCGPLVCISQAPSQNVTINNNFTNSNTQSQIQQQQQQQSLSQQQAVLGASVAPAVSGATQLPSTGSPVEVLFGLVGLLPLGLKLRKFV